MRIANLILAGVSLGAGAAGNLSAATLSGGFAGLYAEAVGSPDITDVVVAVPPAAQGASISFERDDVASGSPTGGSGIGSITLNGVSRAIVSVPASASPQVDVSAEAIATRPPDSSRTGSAGAAAAAALTYEALITQTWTPAGLTFSTAPVIAEISTFISAKVSEVSSAGDAFAQGVTEVRISDRRLTVGPGATFIAEDPARVESLFATVDVFGAGADVFDPGVNAVALTFPVGAPVWVGKRAQVNVSAGIAPGLGLGTVPFFGEATAFAEAVVDPVLLFDQVRFQSDFGALCLAAGLGACPAMEDIFSLEVSPGFGNGTAVIPLPPSLALLLTGFGWLACIARRRCD